MVSWWTILLLSKSNLGIKTCAGKSTTAIPFVLILNDMQKLKIHESNTHSFVDLLKPQTWNCIVTFTHFVQFLDTCISWWCHFMRKGHYKFLLLLRAINFHTWTKVLEPLKLSWKLQNLIIYDLTTFGSIGIVAS